MIKHIVMWRIKDENKAENALKIKHDLEALTDKIDVLRFAEVGVNIQKSDSAYDAVLTTEFDNSADLDTYQNHPDHLVVKKFIGSIAVARAVVDYEMQ